MVLVAVSHNGVFLGTILFKRIEGCHSDERFAADCEPPFFLEPNTVQCIASQLKRGEVEGNVDGHEWNVQDLESIIWRPD